MTERYELTVKGFINLETNDESLTEAIMDSLELAARRTNRNAILMDDHGWRLIHVEKVNEKKQKARTKTGR